jgi:hypothetical protein
LKADDTVLDPLLELISAFSHEPLQSDGELYQRIVESYRRDEVTYALCMGSLTGPKERNMRMLLRPKNLPMVKAFNSLFDIPAMMEQLRLGNIHKWLALHIDEQIINYLNHISVVWKEEICQGKKTIMQSLDIDSIRIVQFRMPTVCSGDADTIKRLFDNGTLFPRVTDSSDRDMLRRNLLSLDKVIPSFETFQENMHYVGLAAKILIRHVVDELPLCKSSRKRSPTILEVLSGSWTAPEVVQVEANDGEMAEIEGPASPYLAFTQLCLACLRLFPWLQDDLPPREDWPQDSFRADVNTQCVAYVLQLASELGFRTSKIQAALSQPSHAGPQPSSPWQEIPDWRGGRPFTRTFWYIRANGFLPTLAATRRRQPNPEFVLLDMTTAFFGNHTVVLKRKSQDTRADDDVDEEMGLDAENDQGDRAPVAPRTAGNKIRPRSRYFGSAAKPRREMAASVTAKAPRQDAAGIPRREAARSVIGQQGIRKAAGLGGAASVSNPFALSLLASPGREAAQGAEGAAIRPTGSSVSEPSHEATVQHVPNLRSESLGLSRDKSASAVTTFGREAARSVFVVNPPIVKPPIVKPPNWDHRAQGIHDIDFTHVPTPPSRLRPTTTRPGRESSRAADASTPSHPPRAARHAFRPAIPPIRGMNKQKAEPTRYLGKHPLEESDISTIRQEGSEKLASKRLRQARAAEEPPSPGTIPVPSDLRDEHNRIAARKRDAVLWDSRVTSMLVQGMGEHGSPSVQSHPLNALVLPVQSTTMDEVEEDGVPSTQSNPLPVESTTRSDLSFIEEEEEEEL